MECSACGAPLPDAEATCRYCGLAAHEREHVWRDTTKTIDVDALTEWLVEKVEKHRGRRVTAEALRVLRGSVVAAIRRDSHEVRITATLDLAGERVDVDETLTRTAARSLFAPAPRKKPRKPLERSADEPKRDEERPAERKTFWDEPYMPYVVTAAIFVVIAAVAIVTAIAETQRHGEPPARGRTNEHHR